MSGQGQYCTFVLNGQHFGIDAVKVQEVIRQADMTRVPLAPPAVRGLINLRGQIVTAIDLRRRLDMPDRASTEAPVSVVIQTDDGPVSLLVDEIGDVLELLSENFEPPPETLRGPTRTVTIGVSKLDGRLLLLLDTEKVLRFDNGNQLN